MPPVACFRRTALSGFVLGLALLPAPSMGQEGAARSTADIARYRVQVNDVLEFLFFKNPELNQTRTVGPDGEVESIDRARSWHSDKHSIHALT